MYQIDTPSAAASLPASTTAGTAGYFTDSDPLTSTAPTIVPAEWLNSLMLEVLNVLSAGSVTPVKNQFNQLATAIVALIRSTTATIALPGSVEKATIAETNAGTADKFIDASLLKNDFAASFGARGYVALPSWLGGFTIQWGHENQSATTEAFTFPTAFSSACYAVVANGDQADGGVNNDLVVVSLESVSASGFTSNGWGVANNGSGNTAIAPHFWWIAVGK